MKCSFGCVYLLIAFCLHAEHPDDAQRYFGFPSWKELKVYVRCMWPGVKQDERSVGYCSRTQFEQILISKMFMKTALDQVDLARIWDCSRSLISKILLKWCRRWGYKSRLHVRLPHLPMHFLEVCSFVLLLFYYHCICVRVC